MGFRVDVGINAQADRRILCALSGNIVQAFEFRNRFDVEAENASIQRLFHFRSGLPDTGKNDFLRVSPGGQHALQLATGNDVKTGTQSGEQIEDGEVGIGFDGVTDQGILASGMGGKDVLKFAQGGSQGRTRINVSRCAELFGQLWQRNVFGMQCAVDAGKCSHGCLAVGVRGAVLTSPTLPWVLPGGSSSGPL